MLTVFKMKYNIESKYLAPHTKRRPKSLIDKVRFVVVHDTGNPNSTAINNVNYYENSKNEMYASAHIFLDDKQIIECIPTGLLNNLPAEKAYHVVYNETKDNEIFGADANDAAIGVEYAFGSKIDADKAYPRYVWVVAYICYFYGLNPRTDVIGHHLIQKGKIDPVNGLSKSGRTYERLLQDIVKEYEECIVKSEENGGMKGDNLLTPTVIKERIYAQNGALKKANVGDYSVSATDVRYIKFNKGTYKLKMVWVKSKTVSQLVKEYGADYGFNFPFFYNSLPIADCKIGNTILSRGYDTVGGAQQTKWYGFAWKNGQPVIGQLGINDDFGADGFLVKTTPLLLNGKGEEVWDWYREQEGTAPDIGKNGSTYVRAQRTVVGIDAEGNLHLAVGDGRSPKYDRGMDLQEMALYMKSKGCLWALNADGGGSSVIADKTGSLGQNSGASERVVHHAILVFMNKPDPLELQRKKFAEIDNQIAYMKEFVDGSGSGTEKWALNYMEQVYDIMLTKKLVKEV